MNWLGLLSSQDQDHSKDERQLLMALGISNNAFLLASDMVRSFMLEVSHSNPDLVVPQAEETLSRGNNLSRKLLQ